MLITAGGRITCQQCSARSKRTKQQCRAPAMKGKKVCRIHGGLSRGPVTEAGRLRCAAAKTKHGLDTRQRRAEVSAGLFNLHELETLGRSIGVITEPPHAEGNHRGNRVIECKILPLSLGGETVSPPPRYRLWMIFLD